MKEFAFDVTLQGVIRINAESEAEARDHLLWLASEEEWINHEFDGVDARLTAACLDLESTEPHLFEVDGKTRE